MFNYAHMFPFLVINQLMLLFQMSVTDLNYMLLSPLLCYLFSAFTICGLKILWQDDHGDFSSVNMDTAVAIRTLEATYQSSADAAAVETMIQRLTEKVVLLLLLSLLSDWPNDNVLSHGCMQILFPRVFFSY